MRWIKHITTAGDDVKISALIDDHGAEAYGIYWLLLETIGLSMGKDSEACELTYSELKWSQKLRCSVRKLRSVVQSMTNLRLIDHQSTDNRLTIAVPNLLKYRDEYSKRSGVCAEQDRDRDTQTATDGEKNTQAPAKQVAALVHEIQIISDPMEDQIREVAERIHIRHPQMRRCSYSVVEKKLRTILKSHKARHGMDKESLLATIDRNHKALCERPDWTESDGKYAKSLEGWLNPSEDRYMVFFDQSKARDSPKSPTQLSFGERKRAEAITMQEMMRGTYDPARSVR